MTAAQNINPNYTTQRFPLPLLGEGARRAGEGSLTHAKSLRKNMTEAEQALWAHLRAKRFMGIKFKRQKPIGGYIVDFVAVEVKLIIEVDGSQHLEAKEYDAERTHYLEGRGFRVLRFWNSECLRDINNVLKRIAEECPSPALRAPSPIQWERVK